MSDIYDFQVKSITGEEKTLEAYKGKVLLIVNTASKCGLTPQFKGLEALYVAYKDQGLEILGFPCNQFLSQDPGSESDIAEFCSLNYGVTFPMHGKIEVNGKNTHPLYKYLKSKAKGMLGTEQIKWNFTKFLVNRDGDVVARFAPNVEPEDIKSNIEKLL